MVELGSALPDATGAGAETPGAGEVADRMTRSFGMGRGLTGRGLTGRGLPGRGFQERGGYRPGAGGHPRIKTDD